MSTTPARSADGLEEAVLTELGDHLGSADKLAASYARQYVRSLRGGPRVRPPHGLHPQIAKLVRELALDASMVGRRVPGTSRTV